jgi:hypothetical protein
MTTFIRVMFLTPVPVALFGFAWAVKIERWFDAAGWLIVAALAMVLGINLWRVAK